ncbi:MAG TPA: 50S ribosomal protein L30 [Thermoplasmata archaeon]|nr:50S ribosomal protein L30 [Thermoplasmata archaeon]
MSWVVVRVRGEIHAKREIAATLRFLHLTRANHATVIPEEPSFRGMLMRVQGYVTWGEAEEATVARLISARGKSPDGKALGPADGAGAAAAPTPEVAALAKTVLENGLPASGALRPLFRLKAPTGGWRSTKKPFALGGALGYRGRAINDLVQRML